MDKRGDASKWDIAIEHYFFEDTDHVAIIDNKLNMYVWCSPV